MSKSHYGGCPGINSVEPICNCPDANPPGFVPYYGPGSLGYVAPVDPMPEVVELLKQIEYLLRTRLK